MRDEQGYERVLQALRDMQEQIEQRIRPVAEQVVQAEVERLRSLSEQQRNALNECLERIDENIMRCRANVDEYQQVRSHLIALNERLTSLGALPEELPDGLPVEDLKQVIVTRMENLRAQGKL